jgi:hypothetical protein
MRHSARPGMGASSTTDSTRPALTDGDAAVRAVTRIERRGVGVLAPFVPFAVARVGGSDPAFCAEARRGQRRGPL